MAVFNYTLPSGSQFKVEAPAGTTQLEADQIFYGQVAAGALVGYQVGQSLTSPASQITKFELSRLDRGTAAVDTVTVLSIVQNLPVVSGVPELVNVPIENPVDQTDIVLTRSGLGPSAVGPLTAFQVQALQAQLANLVDQDSDTISADKGIGRYGLNCLQLELLGYVKPGTWARFLSNTPEQFVAVMRSPGIWTGLNGVYSLDDLLGDENTQNLTQNQLMQASYDSLLAAGVISNVPQAGVSLNQGQIYTAAGLQPLNALSALGVNNLTANNAIEPSSLKTLASGALSNLASAQATINIANRITGEVGALVNNASKYGSLATTAWSQTGALPSLSSLTTGLTNLPTLPNVNIQQIAGGLTGLVPGNIDALKSGLDTLGKASQFSLNFTNPLKTLPSVPALQGIGGATQLTGALAGAQGQLAGLQGQLSGALGGILGGGGNLVSGTQIAAGFNNTVQRSTINSAVTRILGSNKIPTPSFEFPSATSLAQSLDIVQAQNILQGLGRQGAQISNQLSQVQSATRLASAATSTFNRLTG